MKVFDIFTDRGEFSWRKMMTCGCLLIFIVAQLGFLIENKFAELPTAYWSVDAGVFAFYFFKGTIDKLKVVQDANVVKE